MLELLRQRRSIRQFLPRPVDGETLDLLLEAALRAPSSRGRNPWEFIVVTDPGRLAALARAKPHGSALVAGAPLALVVCADPEQCDVWIEDCAIAAITVHYAAAALGLGSCWVQLRLREHGPGTGAESYVRELLGLPARYMVPCLVAIGHPARPLPGHPRSALPWEKIHRERFTAGGGA